MDVIAHTLWTNAVFYTKYAKQRRLRYWAAFFGVLPDFIGFAPAFIYLILTGQFGRPDGWPDHWTVRFAPEAYNYTHSLVMFAALFITVTVIGNAILWFKQREHYRFWLFWPLLGWALHILIDIPTHAGNFYLTPMFFPLSGYRFTHGISWGHPVFMAINYSCLIVAYIALHYYQKRRLQREAGV